MPERIKAPIRTSGKLAGADLAVNIDERLLGNFALLLKTGNDIIGFMSRVSSPVESLQKNVGVAGRPGSSTEAAEPFLQCSWLVGEQRDKSTQRGICSPASNAEPVHVLHVFLVLQGRPRQQVLDDF